MCFPAVAAPMSSCQYTMVPLQGLALVGHCPLDTHMTAPHGVYPANGEYTPNGKPKHCLSGLQQVKKQNKNKTRFYTIHEFLFEYLMYARLSVQDSVDCDMECDTLLQQPNGHLPVYHYSTRCVFIITLIYFLMYWTNTVK